MYIHESPIRCFRKQDPLNMNLVSYDLTPVLLSLNQREYIRLDVYPGRQCQCFGEKFQGRRSHGKQCDKINIDLTQIEII
jgi:hypothetical protein